MSVDEAFATPDEAALASWRSAPAAKARVRCVTARNGRAQVVVETDQSDPDYVDYVYCVEGANGRWREVVSGNGPTARWDDPSEHDWSF